MYHPFWVLNGRDLDERSTPRELSEREDQELSLPGRLDNSHELRVGDVLCGHGGRQMVVLRIAQEYKSGFPVNNLTIDEHHTFAVGPEAVLVHNTAGCPAAAPSRIGPSAERLTEDAAKARTYPYNNPPRTSPQTTPRRVLPGATEGNKALDQLESISKAQQRPRSGSDTSGKRIIDSIDGVSVHALQSASRKSYA